MLKQGAVVEVPEKIFFISKDDVSFGTYSIKKSSNIAKKIYQAHLKIYILYILLLNPNALGPTQPSKHRYITIALP